MFESSEALFLANFYHDAELAVEGQRVRLAVRPTSTQEIETAFTDKSTRMSDAFLMHNVAIVSFFSL